MSYQTGAANDAADLLDKLRLFATANGWTQDFWGNRTAATGKALSLHKSALYATFFSQTSGGYAEDPAPFIGVRGHTGYLADANPDTQTDASAITWSNYLPGPYVAYHFFSGANYLHVVVETTAGTFKHFGTGTLVTQGVVTSGQYVYAARWYYSNPSHLNNPDSYYHGLPFDDQNWTYALQNGTYVRADFGGITPRWHFSRSGDAAGDELKCGYRIDASPQDLLNDAGHSTLTGRAPLWPLWCAVKRGSGYWSDIGYPPDMRFVRIDSLNDGESLTLGTDTWKVFPVHRKNGPIGAPNSGTYGFAFRVVP